MKKFFVQIRNMALIVIAAGGAGFILLLAVYSLPVEKMRQHVQDSLYLYRIENDGYSWGSWHSKQTNVDNFTNCIMLMEAIYPTDAGILDSTLSNRMWNLGEKNSPYRTLIEATDNQFKSNIDTDWNYARYWHGYLIFLKPLLYVTNTGTIRVLNFQLQFLLIISAMLLTYKRLGKYHTFAFAVTLMAINPVTTALCFQNSTVLYITLAAVIFLLRKNELLADNERYIYFFLIVGICTSYFDFLTYPFVSFGIPLSFFVMLNKEKFYNLSVKNALQKMFHCGFAWGFGYVGMWSVKWILATLLTRYNVLVDAFYNALASKLPSAAQEFTFYQVLSKNFHALSGSYIFVLAIFILYMIYRAIKNRQNIYFNKTMAAIFTFIFALPFIWYAVVMKHSYIHDFLVYRELAIAIFGITCITVEIFSERMKS